MENKDNPMRKLLIKKIVINIGVGESGEKLSRAEKLLEILTGRKPVKTLCKKRIPAWHLKKGDKIGVKVTIRKNIDEMLRKLLDAVDFKVKESCFDRFGNFSFGIKSYIDIPGMKYIPEIGDFGMNVCVPIERKGYRVMRRKIKRSKISNKHRVSKEEAIKFMKENFNIQIIE
ncbi:MAG: 50S ribosomal protein L5 [Candidatus Altarchaeaceae archaeon]